MKTSTKFSVNLAYCEMTQADLDEYERVKKEEPEIIWRASEMKPINDKPVLKSADRAGYYITIK